MKKTRPETTLFMLMSVDGKISTGDQNDRDVDKDFPRIDHIKDGLFQYYEREKMTDLYSLNTGKVMEKIGINHKEKSPHKTDVSFIIVDNKPHLNQQGILFLTSWLKKLYVVTSNRKHPAWALAQSENIEMLFYEREIPFPQVFEKFYEHYAIERITIQSGGTLNTILLREHLIDHVSLIVAPCIIGGRTTSTLFDGDALVSEQDLQHIKALLLRKCETLQYSYLHLCYDVCYQEAV